MINFSPRVIAHRGASGYAPENTMAAFVKAGQLGIKWVEFDVMTDMNGLPLIFHDEILDRTTNGSGLVCKYAYSYLQTLDAGRWFNPMFSGERILTLSSLMDFLVDAKINANVELKPSRYAEEKLVINVLKILIPYMSQESRINILFSSFSVDALRILRKYSPEASIGLLLHEWVDGWEQLCDELKCVSVNVNEEILHENAVQKIKDRKRLVLSYTVNQPRRAQELFSWGVDAVFSDIPDRIAFS